MNEIPICGMCQRERTMVGMDVYDYSPLQVITNAPFGWYSADDGEVCPDCLTKTIRSQG